MRKGKIIVAISQNRVIGKKGKMPWNYPEDLRFFKEKTSGSIVVMGRKTFESIGKPLPNRKNIVLSKTLIKSPNIILFRDFDKLLKFLSDKEYFVIGGETIFRLFIRHIDEIYLTEINRDIDGDRFFPKLDNDWKITSITKGKNKDLTFKKLIRKVKNYEI